MSLDVYLIKHGATAFGSGIFVRENGEIREISRAEWDERFPNSEPVIADQMTDDEVYSANITHNLNRMADEAGIYQALWRPEEISITKAAQLVAPLSAGIALLKSDPERFKKFNPENGWGTYEGLVSFVEKYLLACREHPDADIEISR